MMSYKDALQLKPGDRVVVDSQEEILLNAKISGFSFSYSHVYSPACFVLGEDGKSRFCGSVYTIERVINAIVSPELLERAINGKDHCIFGVFPEEPVFTFKELEGSGILFDRWMISRQKDVEEEKINELFNSMIDGGI